MAQPHDNRAAPLVLASKDISRGIAEAMNLAQYEGRRTVITRRGAPVCALVPLADLARLDVPSTDGSNR